MRKLLLSSVALIAMPAFADPVKDTRAIMAGTVTTTKIKNEYISGARDGTAPFKGALSAYKAVRAAEPPLTVKCVDGTVIVAPGACPVPVPPVVTPPEQPAPVTGYVPTPGPDGAAPVPFEFAASVAITPFDLPRSAAPDFGAFRFQCGAGWLRADDPIVYPGQPGASHLHEGYGNLNVTGNTTDVSLATGKSSCGDPRSDKPGNRSAYWIPALLDGKGGVIRPDEHGIYYKRWPKTDPHCNTLGGYPTKFNVEGSRCAPIPNGIKFIYGYNMLDKTQPPTGSIDFKCIQDYHTGEGFSVALGRCSAVAKATGKPTTFLARSEAPNCWDGKNLDTPDHRSHVAYASYGDWGYMRCPTTHPVVIPTFTTTTNYTVLPTDDTTRWAYSCDAMAGTAPGGCFHADYWKKWHPEVEAMWLENCINRQFDCSAGNLGNGFGMVGADVARYYDAAGSLVSIRTNPNRIVPIPQP